MTNELNLPWRVNGTHWVVDDKGYAKAHCDTEANAAYICKAVNLHHELVSMLEAAEEALAPSRNTDAIKQLLERAKR